MSVWQQNLSVVLVASRNALNIGAAARAMNNFGFTDLRCVRPYDAAFRSARSAVGAAPVLANAKVTAELAEAVTDAELIIGCSGLESRKQRHVQRSLPLAASALRTHLEDRKAALLFGSEKFGLSNEDLSHCDWVLTIPTNEACPSMNLGQAVAVCCYEIARRSAPQASLQTPAGVSAGDRERILQCLLPVLRESGYIPTEEISTRTRTLRRFVNRLRLAPEDASLLQGMLRQIDWRLQHPDDSTDLDQGSASESGDS